MGRRGSRALRAAGRGRRPRGADWRRGATHSASTDGRKACWSTSDRGWTNCESAWRSQAARVRELDRFLAQPEAGAVETFAATKNDATGPASERRQKSEQGRLENLRRLDQLRRRMFDDLLATLAWVRELVTMIHLAKFSGVPASRAEELVAQIATAVEGLREVSNWGDAEVLLSRADADETSPTGLGGPQGVSLREE